jgi:predicted site-specific integrase-resolvase
MTKSVTKLNKGFSKINIKKSKKNNKNTIIYNRVSSNSQKDSLKTQRRANSKFINLNNKFINIKTYNDICSSIKNCEELKIWKIIKKYNNINLVVTDASRISRLYSKSKKILKLCKKNNITIYLSDQNKN